MDRAALLGALQPIVAVGRFRLQFEELRLGRSLRPQVGRHAAQDVAERA